MEVRLTPDHEAFIQSSLSSRRFRTADDAVHEALDLLARQESLRAFIGKSSADIGNG